ncbi:MAG: prepilin-type N-terminal cleavage/methylation domain-containing protein [Patescibacteria group bacterium]
MKNLYKKGITAIEILVVVAVVGIIVSVVIPRFSQIRENAVLKAATEDVLSSINKAKSQTLSSLNSSEYGVHFQSDEVIIFTGKVFSSSASSNQTISITPPATISNVNFGGVSSTSGDMYFNRIYNAPSTTGTITISTPTFLKIITIYATGVASAN